MNFDKKIERDERKSKEMLRGQENLLNPLAKTAPADSSPITIQR